MFKGADLPGHHPGGGGHRGGGDHGLRDSVFEEMFTILAAPCLLRPRSLVDMSRFVRDQILYMIGAVAIFASPRDGC
jgi:hypothetical protein